MFSVHRLKVALRFFVRRSLLRFRRFNVNNSIILVSEPRSGSTWLMEVIAQHPRTVINWEPFHPNRGVIPSNYPMGIRPDFRFSESKQKKRRMMEEILTFRKYSEWTTKYLDWGRLPFAKTVLIKMVRGVRLLPYLVEEFEFVHKPIYLVRHPIPTVLSQTTNFHKVDIDNILSEVFNIDVSQEMITYVKSLTSQIEQRLALWCIYSRDFLTLRSTKWITVFYEDLILDPKAVLNEINEACGLAIPIDRIDFNKPSGTDFKNHYIAHSNTEQLSKWLKTVSPSDQEKMQKVLNYFGIEVYSAYEVLPVHSEARI